MRAGRWNRSLLSAALAVLAACSTAYLAEDQPPVKLPARGTVGSSTPDGSAQPGSDGSVAASSEVDAAVGDGSSEGDASAPPPTDPVPPRTRSPGMIECGATPCIGGRSCCVSITGEPTCAGACPVIAIRCDEPADCAKGEQCCAASQGAMAAGTECRAGCGTDYVVCVSDADCDPGKHCVAAPAPIPPPYTFCQ